MESRALKERARHDVILPFTRLIAGPADYTPVIFTDRRADTTWVHQVASAALLQSGLLTYAASPQNIQVNPAVDMLKSIPAVWDETRVLSPSEIGEVAAFARRSGDTWFLAVMNGAQARSFDVPLAFLGDGEYWALIVRDREGDPASLRVEQGVARRENSVTVDMLAGGGYIARFTRR